MSATPSDTPAASSPAAGGQTNHGCLPRGFRLREFVIERVLGDGGFGVVYSALDLRLERRVAIKEYMPSSLATRGSDHSVQMLTSQRHRDAFEIGLRSFINEARMLARFEHPALIKVHQFWQEKGTAYMVMPFYSAPTLRTWVKSRAQPVGEAWLRQFLLAAMDGIEVLHAESCLHRDIAPDNILVREDSAPLLLDFGAARRVIGDLRKALTVIVKPGFAPLEQYADTVKMKQGPWTDVYALAAVAHFVLTGHAPAPAVSRVLADEVVPLRVRLKGRYSDALLGAIDTALAVKPERRPQTMAAFRALLQSEAAEWEPTRLIRRAAVGSTTHKSIELVADAVKAQALEPATPAPRSVQRTAAPITRQRTAAPITSNSRASSEAITVQRRTALLADAKTLSKAVLAAIPDSVWHSRWASFGGYALALLACAGGLALTAHIVERYVEANTPAVLTATVVEAHSQPQAVPAEAAPAPAAAPLTETAAMAEAKPTEVTLAPAMINLPSPAPTAAAAPAAPARSTPAAPARSMPAAKPKAAPHAKVAMIERNQHESGTAALLLTAAAPAAAAPAGRGKTRSLDQMVVPVERAADLAQVAPVELVVAPQPAPLRALEKPQPQFPSSAVRDGIRDGRVLAQMTINSDGSIGRVDIVDAYPRHVFDKEVVRALSAWRYEAPGQARQKTVEFLFSLDR